MAVADLVAPVVVGVPAVVAGAVVGGEVVGRAVGALVGGSVVGTAVVGVFGAVDGIRVGVLELLPAGGAPLAGMIVTGGGRTHR